MRARKFAPVGVVSALAPALAGVAGAANKAGASKDLLARMTLEERPSDSRRGVATP
jgi:hypothetical protein